MSAFLVLICRALLCFATLEWKNEWKLLNGIYHSPSYFDGLFISMSIYLSSDRY